MKPFFSLIIDSKIEQVNLENIPMIREFPDVFPEELPRVLPEAEVDLSIEVVQGTNPISSCIKPCITSCINTYSILRVVNCLH